jgi:hypothetical protein
MTTWNKNARNARRAVKRNRKFLGAIADSLVVASPPKGELVLFASDGEVGAHEFIKVGASELAMQLSLQSILERVRGPKPAEASNEQVQ